MIPASLAGIALLGRDSSFRMLLIEDSTSDSDLVLALLEGELAHADVKVASSLEDALALLDGSHFDVVLADLSLPDADGTAVVRAVRTAHPRTALLVLTGRVDGELALWALAEGAQDYLVKGQHDGPHLATALLHALQRQRAEQEAHRYLQLARGLLDALDAPTCAVGPDSTIIAVNSAWMRFTENNGGHADRCGVGNQYLTVCDEVATDAADSSTSVKVGEALRRVLAGDLDRFEYEYPCHSPDRDRWFSVRITPMANEPEDRGAVISHVDVTEMHAVQMELAHQALHDALTGLPNRQLLVDRLDQALADSKRHETQVGVGFLDLDNFKRINDGLGHLAGDQLLILVADRLRTRIRGGDTLCRYAGDEFIVIWRDLDTAEEAIALGERLVESLSEPFELQNSSVSLAASVGVALGRASQDVEELLQAADAAMYDVKRHGGGRVRLFSTDLRLRVEDRISTEAGLHVAVERSELVLHYQPVIDLDNGHPIAIEALLRWEHPERGLLAPNHFIPAAESSGLIVPIGAWVLTQACHDAAALTGDFAGLSVAVNLSARQLIHPDVVAHVRDALASSGLDPLRLALEVTESAVMEDPDAADSALAGLVELGVRISIDDFGTGYSSLLYLRRYPISVLKLDRSFVAGIGVSPDDEAICSSVVSLAHAVDATSIAEGVETMEQHAALRALGCQQAQGFLWAAAVPVEELDRVLNACRYIPIPNPGLRAAPAIELLEPAIARRIVTLHASGASLHTIAAALNRAAARSPDGHRWNVNTVARHVAAASLALAEE